MTRSNKYTHGKGAPGADISGQVRAGYERAAPDLIAAYEEVRPERLYAPVADLLPTAPVWALDVGAGTGRDAAWLAGQGHRVTAVEPVAALRAAGQRLHAGAGIVWHDDHLPGLTLLRSTAYDLILVNAVWQHVAPAQRPVALATLFRLTTPGGQVILSLRHGPGAPDRPAMPVSTSKTVAQAEDAGFEVVRETSAPSLQSANRDKGVSWDWLVLRRAQSGG
ncbi:MAG: class I SAM-dependent methyltransferase [Ruegeria sp.]|uniref:class I SAM-dependent methyltransferase n=1 Tax=Ruegeria sp. TaxID=1879320 RepID=UPI00349E4DE8